MTSELVRADLVSRSTRRAFCEFAPGLVLRQIDDMWQDEGFEPGAPNQESGQRRSLYQEYLDAVDWTYWPHVERALRVFYETVRDAAPEYVEKPLALLRRDGFEFDEYGRPARLRANVGIAETLLSDLDDPAVILDHLDRIARAVNDADAAQAIGSAKELIESTAKVVLRTRGLPVDDAHDLPALATRAQKALGVHPTKAGSGADAEQGTKKALGGLLAVVVGVGELRNRGFGTGHGGGAPRVGLHARHAHLVVGAARVWCEFVLETLQDPKAPWRQAEFAIAEGSRRDDTSRSGL